MVKNPTPKWLTPRFWPSLPSSGVKFVQCFLYNKCYTKLLNTMEKDFMCIFSSFLKIWADICFLENSLDNLFFQFQGIRNNNNYRRFARFHPRRMELANILSLSCLNYSETQVTEVTEGDFRELKSKQFARETCPRHPKKLTPFGLV